jgi:hypothetical protein
MDRSDYLQQRKGKYMAQALEALEEMVCSQLPETPESSRAVASYREARDRPFPHKDQRAFQRFIEPLLPAHVVESLGNFKGLLRARFNALCSDAKDLVSLSDAGAINGVALEQRDALSPVGRP